VWIIQNENELAENHKIIKNSEMSTHPAGYALVKNCGRCFAKQLPGVYLPIATL
jgi:hypothetical protein